LKRESTDRRLSLSKNTSYSALPSTLSVLCLSTGTAIVDYYYKRNARAVLTRNSTSGGEKDTKKKRKRRCTAIMASSDTGARLFALCRPDKNLSFVEVQSVIAEGVDINAKEDDKLGFTALMYAVANDHLNAVKAPPSS
jgi:ankyrin repeat protein